MLPLTSPIPPGQLFEQFLDSVYTGVPIKIFETGTMRDLAVDAEYGDGWSTLYIARWIKKHPGSSFESCDLNINAIELAHLALESEGLADCCTFRCQDSLKFLSNISWADFIFLDSCDGLDHGIQEFRLAASTGARLIVMDDYSSKALKAVKEARELGWQVSFAGRYSLLRRP